MQVIIPFCIKGIGLTTMIDTILPKHLISIGIDFQIISLEKIRQNLVLDFQKEKNIAPEDIDIAYQATQK